MHAAFRAAAGLTVLGAGAVAGTLLVKGPSPASAFAFLERYDQPGYAAWFGWLLAAPAVLVVAALLVRRTPWPWVAAVTVHLASVLAGAVVVSHWVAWWGWAALATVVTVGLVSVVAALGVPPIRQR